MFWGEIKKEKRPWVPHFKDFPGVPTPFQVRKLDQSHGLGGPPHQHPTLRTGAQETVRLLKPPVGRSCHVNGSFVSTWVSTLLGDRPRLDFTRGPEDSSKERREKKTTAGRATKGCWPHRSKKSFGCWARHGWCGDGVTLKKSVKVVQISWRTGRSQKTRGPKDQGAKD